MANKQEHRSSFEDQWKEAFEDAEVSPSANLWKNIDSQLTAQESGKYRKGFIFYRAVAAACIVCLLGMGYFLLRQGSDSQGNELTNQPTKEETFSEGQTRDNNLALGEDTARKNNQIAEDQARKLTPAEEADLNNALADKRTNNQLAEKATDEVNTLSKRKQNSSRADKSLALSHTANSLIQEHNNANLSTAALSEALAEDRSLAYLPSLGPALSKILESDWVKDIQSLYRVPQTILDEQEDEQAPEFFAGLNLATNYFDPNFSGGARGNFESVASPSPSPDDFINVSNLSQDYAYSSRSTPANSGLENTPQLSLSYGVDVGFMLTKHLSLESGLDYGRMNSRTKTSWVAENYGQDERIPLLASNSMANADYSSRTLFTPQSQELINSFAFLSLPLKLGYNLGFERINFNLSSGVAANFFLNNRLSDERGELATVNISASADGPYRPVYYSGIVSGGVNYLIASNYALSVSPNYNFSLSSLTEEGNSFSSQPNAFGVDFGIRYNFR